MIGGMNSYIPLSRPAINQPVSFIPETDFQLEQVKEIDFKGHVFIVGPSDKTVEKTLLRLLEIADINYSFFISDENKEESVTKTGEKYDRIAFRSYLDSLKPWYNRIDADPYGSTIRARPSRIILDNANSKALYYPWMSPAFIDVHHPVIISWKHDVDRVDVKNEGSAALNPLIETLKSNPYANDLFYALKRSQSTLVVVDDEGRYDSYKIQPVHSEGTF